MTDTAEEKSVIEAVLFDLDGTLIDTVGLILASMRHATRTILGREYTDEELLKGVGTPLTYQMEALSAERANDLMAAYREHNWEHHDELIAEFPGVDDMLEAVAARGMPMGVVTSKSRPVAQRGIDLLGMGDRFEALVCAEDTSRHKPDPDPLLHAAGLMRIDSAACLYVGDSPFDMSAAKSAGAVSVAALWGAFCGQDVLDPGPEYAIESPDDLVALIDGERDRFRLSPTGRETGERNADCGARTGGTV